MTLEEELREGGRFGDGCTCVQCRGADRIRELEAALSACQIECHHLHHCKHEYHGHDVPCPVEARINALLAPAVPSPQASDGK